MRNLIIKYFFLDYKFMLFGKERGYKRAVTPTLISFFIGVFATLLLEPNPLFWIFWIPFAVCIYFGFFLHFHNDVEYRELTHWSQQFQYLQKPSIIGDDPTFPKGDALRFERKRLYQIRDKKFMIHNNYKVINGALPWIITITGMLIAYIIFKTQ